MFGFPDMIFVLTLIRVTSSLKNRIRSSKKFPMSKYLNVHGRCSKSLTEQYLSTVNQIQGRQLVRGNIFQLLMLF